MAPHTAQFNITRIALNLVRFCKRLVRQAERRSRYRRLGWI